MNAGPNSSGAVLWGFDISHLDSRLDALLMRPEFFDIYLELAVDFSLPLGLLGAAAEPNVGFPVRQLASEAGILFCDRFVTLPAPATRQSFGDLLAGLPSGLTELALHPAIDTPELRAITSDWPSRVADHELAVSDHDLEQMVAQAGVTMVGYRLLPRRYAHALSDRASLGPDSVRGRTSSSLGRQAPPLPP